MFRIGEFSNITQVSARLLRYYDEIGLFHPQHTDPQTGHRFYTAGQIPTLNRILALKELGLSLDQIRRMTGDEVNADEIRGMLMMRKAQVEQSLRDEMARFRYIETRIAQIERDGTLEESGIVLRSAPEQPVLSMNMHLPSLDDGIRVCLTMKRTIPPRTGTLNLGHFFAIIHSEGYETADVDVEMGFFVTGDVPEQVALTDEEVLTVRTLPAVDHLLTITRVGVPREAHHRYAALGDWVTAHDFQFDGTPRELFFSGPDPSAPQDTVVEIQYPVRPRTPTVGGGDVQRLGNAS